ncbi:MAG TPA: hypothetical protein VEG08_02200 [Terriglobales bacterium]|nr:hypothetical protein [Terriglobales bacterium]
MSDDPKFDSLMKRMAEEHPPALPSPNLIWWRAQVLKKYEQKQRIERPFTIMRLVAALVCLELAAAVWAVYGQHLSLPRAWLWLAVPAGMVVVTATVASVALLWSAVSGR